MTMRYSYLPLLFMLILYVLSPFNLSATVTATTDPCSNTLVVGEQAVVLPTFSHDLYLAPNTESDRLTVIPPNSVLYVMAGAACDGDDDLAWWQVSTQATVGWIAEARSGDAPTLAPVAPRTDDVSFGGVQFQMDSRLATSVLGQVIPAYNPNNTNLPFWLKTPVFINFALNDLYDNPGTQAKLAVYPAQALGDVQQTNALEMLHNQLSGQSTETRPADLPITNAERVLYGQRKKLHFDGGSGVRMVVYYSNETGVLTSNSLTYVFQGMTTQGEHYVQIYLPLTTPIFPPQAVADDNYERFVADYNSYLIEAEKTLQTADDADFSPSLTLIDTLITSMSIDAEGVSATLAGDMSLIARCELTALADTRLRVAPDVDAQVADYLPANLPVAADAQYQRRGEGFPWWRLAPNEVIVSLPSQNPLPGTRWIRADFTLESGNCAGLPLAIEP